MKIDNSVKPLGSGSSSSSTPRARATGTGSSTVASASTQASLGGLQDVSAALASAPAVNADRIAEIKQAIAEGRFQVNPERIADGLIASVQQMLAGSR